MDVKSGLKNPVRRILSVDIDQVTNRYILQKQRVDKDKDGRPLCIKGRGVCQWCRKLFRTGGGTISYQDTFVWRKITFLWSDSKNWGAPAPPFHRLCGLQWCSQTSMDGDQYSYRLNT